MSLFAARTFWQHPGRGQTDVIDRGCVQVGDLTGSGQGWSALGAAPLLGLTVPSWCRLDRHRQLLRRHPSVPPGQRCEPERPGRGAPTCVSRVARLTRAVAQHVILESQLSQAVLQVGLGSYLPAYAWGLAPRPRRTPALTPPWCDSREGHKGLQIGVLHPREFVVFTLTGKRAHATEGVAAGVGVHQPAAPAAQGDKAAERQYMLEKLGGVRLPRSAANFVHAPFGGAQGPNVCVQSRDGALLFLGRNAIAFERFLPGFLLPGPLAYLPVRWLKGGCVMEQPFDNRRPPCRASMPWPP